MKSKMTWRFWRSIALVLAAAAVVSGLLAADWQQSRRSGPALSASQRASLAVTALERLVVRPEASRAGYSRKQFSDGWAIVDTCTVRDKILARDMVGVRFRAPGDCTVIAGTLDDPYTGKTIHFVRGPGTSSAVQIDHAVAISDTWRTGAQELSKSRREQLYNDSLELLAVDGPANEEKSDGDAAAWLPSNADYVCRYVARQIAVKQKYHLWVTSAEHTAMKKELAKCPGQLLPAVGS